MATDSLTETKPCEVIYSVGSQTVPSPTSPRWTFVAHASRSAITVRLIPWAAESSVPMRKETFIADTHETLDKRRFLFIWLRFSEFPRTTRFRLDFQRSVTAAILVGVVVVSVPKQISAP